MAPVMIHKAPTQTARQRKSSANPPPAIRQVAQHRDDPTLPVRINACADAASNGQRTYDEDQYMLRMILLLFVALVLPSLIAIVYMIVNPDALQYDIRPQIDFSMWNSGQA